MTLTLADVVVILIILIIAIFAVYEIVNRATEKLRVDINADLRNALELAFSQKRWPRKANLPKTNLAIRQGENVNAIMLYAASCGYNYAYPTRYGQLVPHCEWIDQYGRATMNFHIQFSVK